MFVPLKWTKNSLSLVPEKIYYQNDFAVLSEGRDLWHFLTLVLACPPFVLSVKKLSVSHKVTCLFPEGTGIDAYFIILAISWIKLALEEIKAASGPLWWTACIMRSGILLPWSTAINKILSLPIADRDFLVLRFSRWTGRSSHKMFPNFIAF